MVDVINESNGRVIKNVEYTNSLMGLMKGLMFRKSGALLMDFGEDCAPSIWMLFMRFPIDIVFVSSDGRVVDVVKRAEPISLSPRTWRIYRPEAKCRFVLELPAGMAEDFDLEKGSILTFKF